MCELTNHSLLYYNYYYIPLTSSTNNHVFMFTCALAWRWSRASRKAGALAHNLDILRRSHRIKFRTTIYAYHSVHVSSVGGLHMVSGRKTPMHVVAKSGWQLYADHPFNIKTILNMWLYVLRLLADCAWQRAQVVFFFYVALNASHRKFENQF